MKWPEIYEPGSKALLKAWELAPICQFPEELVGIPSFKRKWNRPLSWGESQIVIRTTTGFATLQQTSLWQKLVSQSAGQILQLIEGGKVPDNKQFLFWGDSTVIWIEQTRSLASSCKIDSSMKAWFDVLCADINVYNAYLTSLSQILVP